MGHDRGKIPWAGPGSAAGTGIRRRDVKEKGRDFQIPSNKQPITNNK
jgi:hypothetical protein